MRAIAIAVAALLLAAPPAMAQGEREAPPRGDTPQQLLEEGARNIVEAMRLLLKMIPMYEAPEILENGDILIRRKRPEEGKPPQGEKDGKITL